MFYEEQVVQSLKKVPAHSNNDALHTKTVWSMQLIHMHIQQFPT